MIPVRDWKLKNKLRIHSFSEKWDYCPDPFENESFGSWFTRLSKGNYAEVKKILKSFSINNFYLDSIFYLYPDYLIKLISPYLNKNVNYNIFKLDLKFKDLNKLKNKYLRSKYCIKCLSSNTPYFRSEWLKPSTSRCNKHKILLRSSCPYCNSKINFWMTKWDEKITDCYYCHKSLIEMENDKICTIFAEERQTRTKNTVDTFNRKSLLIYINLRPYPSFYEQVKLKPKARLHWIDRKVFEFIKLTFLIPLSKFDIYTSIMVDKKTVINSINHLLKKQLIVETLYSDIQSKSIFVGYIMNYF